MKRFDPAVVKLAAFMLVGVGCLILVLGLGFSIRAGSAGPLRPPMRIIQAGVTTIGTDVAQLQRGEGDGDEQPNSLFVPSYAISATEVTVGMYRRVVGNPRSPTAWKRWFQRTWRQPPWRRESGLSAFLFYGAWEEENLPVLEVSWLEAVRYCNTLSELDGLKPHYTPDGDAVETEDGAFGYRLPTGPEWERAARAGSTEAYWTGGDADRVVGTDWIADNSGGVPHAVATLDPNPWGLYDVQGNAKEWVDGHYCDRDIWMNCEPEAREARGGSFSESAYEARVANRCGDWPGFRCVNIGFRVARTVPAP